MGPLEHSVVCFILGASKSLNARLERGRAVVNNINFHHHGNDEALRNEIGLYVDAIASRWRY